MRKSTREILEDLQVWIQVYVIGWSKEGTDMKKVMLKELDKVFDEEEDK